MLSTYLILAKAADGKQTDSHGKPRRQLRPQDGYSKLKEELQREKKKREKLLDQNDDLQRELYFLRREYEESIIQYEKDRTVFEESHARLTQENNKVIQESEQKFHVMKKSESDIKLLKEENLKLKKDLERTGGISDELSGDVLNLGREVTMLGTQLEQSRKQIQENEKEQNSKLSQITNELGEIFTRLEKAKNILNANVPTDSQNNTRLAFKTPDEAMEAIRKRLDNVILAIQNASTFISGNQPGMYRIKHLLEDKDKLNCTIQNLKKKAESDKWEKKRQRDHIVKLKEKLREHEMQMKKLQR